MGLPYPVKPCDHATFMRKNGPQGKQRMASVVEKNQGERVLAHPSPRLLREVPSGMGTAVDSISRVLCGC